MKKTISLLLASVAAAGLGQAATSLHGTDFADFQNGAHNATQGAAALYQVKVNGTNYIGGGATTYKGFYIGSGSGLKFNHSKDSTVTYLYLGADVKFSTTEGDPEKNEIRWSNGSANSVKMTGAGWLDINAAYTERIKVTDMTGGTVYLNEHGMLGGTTLAATNSVEAEAVLSLSDIAASPYTQSKVVGDNLWVVTRELLTSDTADGYNNWGGTVTLNFGGEAGQLEQSPLTEYSKDDIGKYWVIAEGKTLKVAYVMPEPATATLSLLALAGLAARRRRK